MYANFTSAQLCSQLCYLLTDVGKFIEEEFDYDTLKEVTEDDLIQMGVKIGSRRKLLAALRAAPMSGHHGLSASSAEKNWTIEYAQRAPETHSTYLSAATRNCI